jgi:hypothetical protein
MEERLLLDRVYVDGYGIPVAKRVQHAVSIDADGAYPSLSWF